MLRLFGTGHLQEDRIVEDLIRAGFEVWPLDPNTGRQIEATDETGHFVTKIDGIIKGIPGNEQAPHLLEIKTHNKSSFASVVKHGVKKAKPMHYSQMQISMSLLKKERGIYVALCKDDEQFYVERVHPDPVVQKNVDKKIHTLVNATLKPAGISPDGESFGCKFCDMKEVCTGRVESLKTCRSCVHVDPAVLPGEWVCSLSGGTLSKHAQKMACGEYECL